MVKYREKAPSFIFSYADASAEYSAKRQALWECLASWEQDDDWYTLWSKYVTRPVDEIPGYSGVGQDSPIIDVALTSIFEEYGKVQKKLRNTSQD